MDLIIESQRTMQLEKLLRDRNIPYEVTIPDMNHSPSRLESGNLKSDRSKLGKKSSNGFDWKDFYPLAEIYRFLHRLEAQYPAICTVITIGKTEEERDIKVLKISNSDARNFGVWIDGATHAREWIGVSVVTFIANHVAKHFEDLPMYMRNKDWYFLPVANPDGYCYTHEQDRMWRKNRAHYNGKCCGVDLNRNFSFKWDRGKEQNSQDPDHLNFRGCEPFSEPETAAIKDLILTSNTVFKVFISFHSYSEVITFPWTSSAEPCPDYVNLLDGGLQIAKAIKEVSGHLYKVGSFKDLMYNAVGTSIDWSYGTAKIPFSYLIELGNKKHRFLLPKKDIFDTCQEMLRGIDALMFFVDKKTSNVKVSEKTNKNSTNKKTRIESKI